MKTVSLTSILVLLIMCLWLSGAILGQSSPVQSSYFGFTLTPSEVPPPTDTPAPGVTPSPTPRTGTVEEEQKTSVPELPVSGEGRPGLNEFIMNIFAPPFSLPDLETISLPDDSTRIRRIVIPAIGVDSRVAGVSFNGKTWDISQYHHVAAWLAETSLPGQGGNTVLTGHVSSILTLTPLFARLRELQPGSIVRLETSRAEYVYRVREQRVVQPTDLSVLRPSGTPTVTLLTCTGWNEEQQTFLLRRAVIAELVEVNLKAPDRPTPRRPGYTAAE